MKQFRLSVTVLLFVVMHAAAQDDSIAVARIEFMSGKELYADFCSRCHGQDGRGKISEEMIGNMDAPPPDFTDPYFSSGEKRRSWFNVIKYGGGIEGLSMSMPAWGEAISDSQINQLVDRLKSFVDQDRYPQGELNFVRAHTVTKAMAEQEALLLPSWTTSTVNGQKETSTRTVLYYANRFGNRFQYEAQVPLCTASVSGGSLYGLGDIELDFKYAFHDDAENLNILSAGFEWKLPTGSASKGFGTGTISAVPYLAGGLEIRDLLQFQSSLEVDAPLDRSKGTPELNFAVSSTLLTTQARQGIFPGLEFDASKNLGNDESTLSVVPTVYFTLSKRGHLALSVGRVFPVSGERTFDSQWLAFFLWDYPDGPLW